MAPDASTPALRGSLIAKQGIHGLMGSPIAMGQSHFLGTGMEGIDILLESQGRADFMYKTILSLCMVHKATQSPCGLGIFWVAACWASDMNVPWEAYQAE